MQNDRFGMTQPRYGRWFHNTERWLIHIKEHRTGDIVPVRRRNGQLSYQELGIQVAPELYRVVRKVPDADIPPDRLIEYDPARTQPTLNCNCQLVTT